MADPKSRREAGLDVLSTLSGSKAASAGMAAFFESLGAVGDLALLTGAGEIWSRTQLSRRDRSMVVISILTALAREQELRAHLRGGLHHGLERSEIDEIMVQLAAYVGLPFALGGAVAASEVFAEADGTETRSSPPAPLEEKDDETRRRDGKDVLKTLLGNPDMDMDFAASATLDQLGEMGVLVLDYAFGEVWARPQLSRRDRSVVVVSALTALNLKHELEIHIRGALAHGVRRAEVEEVMMTVVAYGGFPRAIDGLLLARKVFGETPA